MTNSTPALTFFMASEWLAGSIGRSGRRGAGRVWRGWRSGRPAAFGTWGMPMDLDYLLRRLETERQAAASAICPQARQAHAELAREYEERIAVLRGDHHVGLKLVQS